MDDEPKKEALRWYLMQQMRRQIIDCILTGENAKNKTELYEFIGWEHRHNIDYHLDRLLAKHVLVALPHQENERRKVYAIAPDNEALQEALRELFPHHFTESEVIHHAKRSPFTRASARSRRSPRAGE